MKKLLFFNFSILCAAMLLTSNTMQAALGGRLTRALKPGLRVLQPLQPAGQQAAARFTPTLPPLQCIQVCDKTSPIEPQVAKKIYTLEEELEIARAEALEKEKAIRLKFKTNKPRSRLRENLDAAEAAFNVAVTNNSNARAEKLELLKNPEADPNQIAAAEQKTQRTQLAMDKAKKTLKIAHNLWFCQQ